MRIPRACRLVAVLGSLFATSRGADAAVETYISLGDSLAFGYTDFQSLVPSYADQGYVSLFADTLRDRNGGVRPNVINLGIYGETTSTFSSGGLPTTAYNLNYPNPTASQSSLFLAKVAGEEAAGRSIGTVSISMGSNDLFALATTPGYLDLPIQQRFSLLEEALGAFQVRYDALLGEIRTRLPEADLLVLGTYDPFPAVPGSPFAGLAGPAIQFLNVIISGLATKHGGHYVDTYSAIQGNEATYTNILAIDPLSNDYNVHPNASGYAAIAAQLEAVQLESVPEPGGVILVGMGLLGLLGYSRHRRAIPA